MKAKVLVNVEREAALEAIRALDALGDALAESGWPKKLKRTYRDARAGLIEAVGYAALLNGLSEIPAD
ncbi:MAG: hypothetical protein JSR60_14735 [Proteobacteria bacterium]|nr:hypothetical protein [Pseudomonadota bacterium]